MLFSVPSELLTFYYFFSPILIDAAAAASTPASLEALVSYINITNRKTSPLLEKFLYACAFSSQPSPHLINIITVSDSFPLNHCIYS